MNNKSFENYQLQNYIVKIRQYSLLWEFYIIRIFMKYIVKLIILNEYWLVSATYLNSFVKKSVKSEVKNTEIKKDCDSNKEPKIEYISRTP